jgi:Bacteriophage phi-29 early protein GP16.
MNFIILLAFILILSILFIFTLSVLSKRTIKETKEVGNTVKQNLNSYSEEIKAQRQELKELNAIIKAKHQELENLKNAVEGMHIRNNSSIPVNVENVLDIYETNGIKISLDIIEELCYLKLDSEEMIFNFIEKQRKSWKLENSKGVIKEVM